MITEDYVSFETSKLLKEKGFDYISFHCYEEKGVNGILFVTLSAPLSNSDLDNTIEPHKCYSAPTLQKAMKWLKEKHKITIGIVFKGDRIYYEIHKNNEFVFGVDTPESYAKVCDEAIKYCLKLVKND